MIAFDLICSNGHLFECWFKDSASYEDQKSAGIINCPVCDDPQIERVYSPFMIKRSEDKEKGKMDPYQVSRFIEAYLDKHFEDVGGEFYNEAIKIHYGESKKRNIKGTTTPEEEVILKEEGVPFIKIPIVKRLLN